MANLTTPSRRKFVKKSLAVSAGAVAFPQVLTRDARSSGGTAQDRKDYDVVEEVAKYRKIDAYCTANPDMELADKLGIGRMYVGNPMRWLDWTPDEFRQANDEMIDLMKKHPGRIIGQISVNPHFSRESLEEIDRCVDQGMVGSRLYYQAKINDPIYYPVIEKLADLNMIIFIHGEAQIGVGGYRMKYDVGRPATISVPEDFLEAAQRYPEAMFQFAHIGGGGDWEYMCKAFREQSNIFVDVGGSNNEEGMVEFAVHCLGEDRVLFGTDNSYYQGVGKVICADLSDRQKQKIFFDNYNALLKKGGYHVD